MTVLLFVVGILILVFGIMVSIAWHELGHFVAAKRFGVKVPEFFVGFGPTLFSVRRGETEFGVKAIPLGGFVRMIGMLPPARNSGSALGRSRRTGPFQGLIDDARAQSALDVTPADADRQFWTRKPWQRVVVMAAGPFQNLVLAFILLAVWLMGVGVPVGQNTTVQSVSECVLPASEANQVTECPAGAPPTPAANAGILPGDTIVALNGQPFTAEQWTDLQRALRAAVGTAVVTVDRDGQRLDLSADLIRTQLWDLDDRERIVEGSFLGVSPQQVLERQNLGEVFVTTGETVVRIGDALINLPERLPNLFGAAFLGGERDQEGPIGVVGVSRIGGEVLAEELPFATQVALLLNVMVAVNMSLFIFNLLPLPPLDGGQIFPAIWEAIRKRLARLRGRPDPGPVDAAKLLPVAYVVALLFIAWSAVLLVADLVNPILLFG